MVKYFVTDPCYVIDSNTEEGNKEWRRYLDACEYRGRYIMSNVPYPYELGGMKMITSQSIPWGDIGFSFRDQQFEADSGTIAIFEVDHEFENTTNHGFGLLLDNLDDAITAIDIAMTCWGPCWVDGKVFGSDEEEE